MDVLFGAFQDLSSDSAEAQMDEEYPDFNYSILHFLPKKRLTHPPLPFLPLSPSISSSLPPFSPLAACLPAWLLACLTPLPASVIASSIVAFLSSLALPAWLPPGAIPSAPASSAPPRPRVAEQTNARHQAQGAQQCA